MVIDHDDEAHWLFYISLITGMHHLDEDEDDLSKRWKQPSSFSPKLSLYPTVLDVRAELMLSSSGKDYFNFEQQLFFLNLMMIRMMVLS